MSELEKTVSRRSFLTGSAIAAASVVGGAAFAGCASSDAGSASASSSSEAPEQAPAEGGASSAETSAAESSAASTSSWRTPMAEIADSDIAATYDADVVVVGSGFAGVTAFRELCEEGYKVIALEKQSEEGFMAVGNEFASLNAAILQERGVPHIDPVEFYQNWMKITGNMPNPDLVMKFAQNSEEASNWYLSELTDADFETMTTAFYPPTEHQLSELSGIKFWGSVCSFYGECNQTKIQGTNRDAGVAAGGEVHWQTEGLYLTKDGDAISGVVAQGPDGYEKINCKAVVIATGGFGGNPEMLQDLIYDVQGNLVGEEKISSMSPNNGAGIKMAYWAGAHLETTPIPGMNFRGLSVPGKMNCLPQAVWIDENGRRFCNEFYPTSEQRGLQTVFSARKTKFAVVDNDFTEYRQYTIPQHAGFDATEANIQSLRDSLDEAYAKFNGTYEEPAEDEGAAAAAAAPGGEGGPGGPGGEGGGEGGPGGGGGGPMTGASWVADDTLEGLGAQMGLQGEALQNFVAQIEEYNAYCEAGADQQYGRAAEVLFPVKNGPFYATTFDPELGETMVTCGGIITNGEQNALDQNFEPIPGLYVSGNDCGRRFGYEYITPIPGCSLGMAITLGRECGKSVGKFLG